MLIPLILVAFLLWLAWRYLNSNFNYWKIRNVPFVEGKPLVGSMWSVFSTKEHMIDYHNRLYNEFDGEPFYGIFQSFSPTLVVRDPLLAKDILVKDFSHFTDHGMINVHEDADPLEAKNLFNMNGDAWRNMRAQLAPTFTSGRMKNMFPLINECAEEFENYLRKVAETGEEIEMKEIISLYTTDVIGSAVFGIKCNSIQNPNNVFRTMSKKLLKPGIWLRIKFLIVFLMPELSYRLRVSIINKEMTEFFRKLVSDTMQLRKTTGETRKDFIQLLSEIKEKGQLNALDEDDKKEIENYASKEWDYKTYKWNDDDITAQGMIFFFAGFETTSTMLTFTLLELGANPDVVKRAQENITEVLKKHNNKVSYQALQEMHYIDWIMQESLRKYPAAVFLGRVCTKDYVIPNTKIPIEKGVRVIIPSFAVQNDPKNFPNPEKFEPERFSTDEYKNQYCYTPFGEGPRKCIGNRFALLQAKLALFTIINNFDIKLASRTYYPVVFDRKNMFIENKSGVWIKLIARKH